MPMTADHGGRGQERHDVITLWVMNIYYSRANQKPLNIPYGYVVWGKKNRGQDFMKLLEM